MTVALDVMGGDMIPEAPIKGALESARDQGIQIILVGPENVIENELAKHNVKNLPISIVDAPQIVEMDEQPAVALRKKRNSSIRVGLQLVKSGKASAFVSAGNTGAIMAFAKSALKPLESVERPAIAQVFPARKGPIVVIDMGANVDCKAEYLVQFAIMGAVYSRTILKVENPTVGLLNIGTEKSKGNELTKLAFILLEQSKRVNFVGNVEGDEILKSPPDVVVCDGFVGNVLLKSGESIFEVIRETLAEAVHSGGVFRKLGYLMMSPAFKKLKRVFDYEAYGGAPLLGLRGPCIICHGRSSPTAIRNAIGVAEQLAATGISDETERQLMNFDTGNADGTNENEYNERDMG